MLSKSTMLKGSARMCSRSNNSTRLVRPFASRSGLQEDRSKKVVEDIKRLKYQMESKTKMENTSLETLDEQDIAQVYKELAAPIPMRPKISSNYLENLRIRFLDTRQQLESTTQAAIVSGPEAPTVAPELVNSDIVSENNTEKPLGFGELTLADFEQLIHVNALAKRPAEAKQSFEMMEKYNIQPSVRAMNHLMDAYANTDDLHRTISTFKEIEQLGYKPDIFSFGTLIKAFIVHSRLDDAFVIFEKLKATGMIPSQPIFSNLISGCLKANKVKKAWQVFDSMRLSYHQPDEVSFTLMLHACAKRGEVERALNLFEDMAGCNLYPTDVTFNTLINACAKRPDYYTEAFSLLKQMQEQYGFQPDKITFNTLLTACARKKDLKQARLVLTAMWEDVEKNGDRSLLVPDSQTFTNLFWCYASYLPQPNKQKEQQSNSSDKEISTQVLLLPTRMPNKRSEVVKEAKYIFEKLKNENVQVTSALLNAYLALHTSQKQVSSSVDIYTREFEQHEVEKDGFTYYHMLQFCYKNKDGKLVWKVWGEYQDFLESRRKVFGEKRSVASVTEQKAVDAEQNMVAMKEGWTITEQQKIAILMANTLAVSNDLKNSISILSSELRRSNRILPPRLQDMMPTYNKCIQLENEELRKQLFHLCAKSEKKAPGNSKYKRVNS